MPLRVTFASPSRAATIVLAGISRRLADMATGWSPAPHELDDHLLRDIGKERVELSGVVMRRNDGS